MDFLFFFCVVPYTYASIILFMIFGFDWYLIARGYNKSLIR